MMVMMMMIMIAGFVDSVTTPIKSWLERMMMSDDCSRMSVVDDDQMMMKDEEERMCMCMVCLCEVETGERLAMLHTCKHGFHVECIEAWLKHHTNCPLCRTTTTTHHLFLFPTANQQQRRSQHVITIVIIYLINKFFEITRCCGYRLLHTIATWLTTSFTHEALQSALSESCTNYL